MIHWDADTSSGQVSFRTQARSPPAAKALLRAPVALHIFDRESPCEYKVWCANDFAARDRTQGVLYLADTDANGGGFQCIPGHHRRFEDWHG
jgi:hypothetical protein